MQKYTTEQQWQVMSQGGNSLGNAPYYKEAAQIFIEPKPRAWEAPLRPATMALSVMHGALTPYFRGGVNVVRHTTEKRKQTKCARQHRACRNSHINPNGRWYRRGTPPRLATRRTIQRQRNSSTKPKPRAWGVPLRQKHYGSFRIGWTLTPYFRGGEIVIRHTTETPKKRNPSYTPAQGMQKHT